MSEELLKDHGRLVYGKISLKKVTPILGGKNYGFPGKMFPSTNPLRRVAKLCVISCFLVCKDFRLELADRTTYH